VFQGEPCPPHSLLVRVLTVIGLMKMKRLMLQQVLVVVRN
jgi:hypothetical protein